MSKRREYFRKHRAQLVSEGMCVRCQMVARPYRMLCHRCTTLKAEYDRGRKRSGLKVRYNRRNE